MLKTDKPRSRNKEIVVQNAADELLIYDLKTYKALCLNETSAMVFRLCDGTRTAAEIGGKMSEKLNKRVSEDFVWLALEGLKKNDLLENADELTDYFKGLTRREAVKKVGFASVIALPIVSSVVAPTAAMAQSGTTANGQSCSTNPQCVSGNCRATTGAPSPACCAATTTRSPAFAPGPVGGCFSTATECQGTYAQQNCCSGSATASAGLGSGVNCPTTQFTCSCNPY